MAMLRLHMLPLPLIFAVCFATSVVEGQDAAVPTMEEIIAAARQRQEAVTSGKFDWIAERWMKKGARNIGRLGRSAPTNPPEDLEIMAERMLLFSGGKVRYESVGPDWYSTRETDAPFRLTTTWNGKKSYKFQDPEGDWSGRVVNSAWFRDLRTFDPIAWTYRMFDSNWTVFDIHDFFVRPAFEKAGGELCVVLEFSKTNQARPQWEPLVRRLWLSRDRQFVVRRYEMGAGASVFTRVEVEYEDSPQGISVPIRWTRVEGARSDPPIEINRSEVSHCEFNVPVASDAFELTFPALVQEEGVEEPYIVREDGSHRVITEAELLRGATYEDLLATPSGHAKLTPLKTSPYVWMFWSVQALLATGILVYVYRRRLARSGD